MASTASKEYLAREWWWRFYRAAYRGGAEWYLPDIPGNYLGTMARAIAYASAGGLAVDQPLNERSFLLRFEKESQADYDQRRAHSYYPGYPAQVIDIYTAHVLARPPTTSGPPSYTAWLADPMGNGRQMSELRGRMITQAQVFGHAFSVTDMPSASAPVVTEADRAGAPYTYVLSPLDVPAWQPDARGSLLWARVRQALVADAPDPSAMDAPARTVYRVWTRQETWLEGDDGKEMVGTRQTHGLGKVPLDVLYSEKDPEGGFCGLSRVRDISFVAREIYNLISQRQMILYHNTFPWFLFPDAANRLGKDLVIGNRQAIAYDPAGGTPSTLAPGLEGARLLGEVIQECVLEIRGLAGLSRGRAEESVQARSGDALLVETQDKGAMLRKLATNAEEWERAVGDTVVRWADGHPAETEGPNALTVSYPRSFNVQALADDLDEAIKLKQLDIQPKAWRAISDGLVRRRLAELPTAEVDALLADTVAEAPAPAEEKTNGEVRARPTEEEGEGEGEPVREGAG